MGQGLIQAQSTIAVDGLKLPAVMFPTGFAIGASLGTLASVGAGTGSLGPGPGPGYTLLTSVNFDNGSVSPLHIDPVFAPDMSVVDDPTGAGRGKVLQIHYHGTNQDCNRSVQLWWPDFQAQTGRPGIGLGQGFYFTGDFYLPATVDQTILVRKLTYWQSANWANQPEFWATAQIFGSGLQCADDFSWGDYTVNPDDKHGTYSAGVWTHLEIECVLETALGRTDGLARRWQNGVLQHNETSKQWCNPAWAGVYAPPLPYWQAFYVGDQVSDTTKSFDELRYWDNLNFYYK